MEGGKNKGSLSINKIAAEQYSINVILCFIRPNRMFCHKEDSGYTDTLGAGGNCRYIRGI